MRANQNPCDFWLFFLAFPEALSNRENETQDYEDLSGEALLHETGEASHCNALPGKERAPKLERSNWKNPSGKGYFLC